VIRGTGREAGVVFGTLVVLAAALPGWASAQSAALGGRTVVSHAVDQSPAQVRRYWTRERMRNAEPAGVRITPGPQADNAPTEPIGEPKLVLPAGPGVPDTSAGLIDGILSGGGPETKAAVDVGANNAGFPQRVHGKVFFTISDGSAPGDYLCSGTVVRSRSHTLVWTAGHCVHDLLEFGGGYATNFEFVPGYRDGQKPFGEWTATKLLTTTGFINSEDERFDAGAAIVNRDGNGRGIQDAVGARGIAFNQPRNQFYQAFGYPRQSPFNGQRLIRCDSNYEGGDSFFSSPQPMRIFCNMTGGSSGGGWVVDDDFVASVTVYGYAPDLDCDAGLFDGCLYGPYFGDTIQDLYKKARGDKLKCSGDEVTNLGTGGSDDFEGTDRPDAFKLRGRGDSAKGRRGQDKACGGNGGDHLSGGDGDDELKGGKGRDVLIGGPGFDVCKGGKGRDKAHDCEEMKKV
jgi:V8-like Glu-specific endopeptidase